MSGIASFPRASRLYWSAYTDPEGTSEPSDPLRFNMYAQRLGNILLPGITTRTERLRYLSMVCAGLSATSGGQGTLRAHRQAFLPFERGWALAMAISVDGELKWSEEGSGQPSLKPEYRGLRGVNRVIAHYRTIHAQPSVRPSAYVLLKSQDAQGGLGAYVVTLRHFGFVQPNSLALSAAGRELAAAFNPRLRGAAIDTLVDQHAVSRRKLERLGEALSLGSPSDPERQIVRQVIFEARGSVVADTIARMVNARPDTTDPAALLQGIARRKGDPLERAAQYAIDFDPLRVALLQLFSSLGSQLMAQAGSSSLSDLVTDDMEASANAARKAAERLTLNAEPEGLEAVSTLARDVARGSSTADTVQAAVAFHRREGRSWIVHDRGDRYQVGRHGSFEQPDAAFHGYTVTRAMQLLQDTQAAA